MYSQNQMLFFSILWNNNLHNYFDRHVYPSLYGSVCLSFITLYDIQFLQLYHKLQPIKVARYALRVKKWILGDPETPQVDEARQS